MSYTLTPKEFVALKGKLTRAVNSKNADKIISTVNSAFAIFEAKGYPDNWSNWQRAKDDAEFEKSRNAKWRAF